MKIKNISISFFVLASLLVLSFAFYVSAENASTGTKSVFLDSDQDGLSDEEEKILGTNPNNPDTDGDGYSDGAEVKSGYDPLKPAPGDKIVPNKAADSTTSTTTSGSVKGDSTSTDKTTSATDPTITSTTNTNSDSSDNSDNLTADLVQKISAMTASTTGDKGVGVDNVQTLVDESLSGQSTTFSEDSLPTVDRSKIKVKKQNYSKLSDKKAQEKKKEDFLDYVTAVFYIFSSNSPKPITSISDMPSFFTDMTKLVTSAISKRDPKELESLAASQTKILEQLNDVEVPEEMVDTHVKALQFALYAQQIPDLIKPKDNDPMGDISNLSKIESYITSLSSFVMSLQGDLTKYNLTYDDDIKKRLNGLGIETPDAVDSFFNTVQSSTTTTDTGTDTTSTDTQP